MEVINMYCILKISKKDVLSLDLLSLWTFCLHVWSSRCFVPSHVFPSGCFVPLSFCLTDVMSLAIMSLDILSLDVYSLWTFCLRTFCLGTNCIVVIPVWQYGGLVGS
jgi:hypothetical protein